VSALPPAKQTAGHIEKETDERPTPACHANCVGLLYLMSYQSEAEFSFEKSLRQCGQVERPTSNKGILSILIAVTNRSHSN
jgi:hypothetical protein